MRMNHLLLETARLLLAFALICAGLIIMATGAWLLLR